MENVKEPENFDHEAFAVKAKAIYDNYKTAEFEAEHKGHYAAVHVESGEVFIGETQIQAYYSALKKHPNTFFFFIRIGLPPVKKRGIYRRKKKV
jgi:hypothetical protein